LQGLQVKAVQAQFAMTREFLRDLEHLDQSQWEVQEWLRSREHSLVGEEDDLPKFESRL
jgi:hypothetical protein